MEIVFTKCMGVPQAEIEAHQTIQKEFHHTAFSTGWRGYASFALARPGRGAGDDDLDLVLITHTTILVIELKGWNGKLLQSRGGNWFKDGEDRGPSPVDVVNLKVKKLASVMTQKLGKDKTPFIRGFVVLHGKINNIDITPDEERSVLNLTELLSFRFQDCYKTYLGTPGKLNPLKFLSVYDQFFQSSSFRPKIYYIDGFRPEGDAIFGHPKNIYKEFRGIAKDDPNVQALLRLWDFKAAGTDLIGEHQRSLIALREQRVIDYVSERNEELSLSLLRPLVRRTAEDVTLDFSEIYRLPPRATRLTEFQHSILSKLSEEERVDLVKALLSRFADLHDLRVAHRDVGTHSLWINRPAKIMVSGFPTAYFPEMKTVASFREKVKVEEASLPEESIAGETATPYLRDVFMLGVISYLILFGERPPMVAGLYTWASHANDPYGGALNAFLMQSLQTDPAKRFSNAREMLEFLNQATVKEQNDVIDYAVFEAFKAESTVRDYKELQVFEDNEDRLFFKAASDQGECTVKVWYGAEPDKKRPDFSLRLLTFLERARAIKGFGISGFPRIIDFGITRRSLMLVYHWVHGTTLTEWSQQDVTLERRLGVAESLVDILDRLHTLEMAHGDIHPKNIIISDNDAPIFIDVLDFRFSGDDAYTTAYLPDNYKSLSPYERDRYGLAAVLSEVLGASRTNPKEGSLNVPKVYEELARLLAIESLSSLSPLKASLIHARKATQGEEIPEFIVLVQNLAYIGIVPGEMRSDNGKFHVSLQKDRTNKSLYRFVVTGIGKQLSFLWDTQKEAPVRLKLKNVAQSELVRRQMLSDVKIKLKIFLADAPVDSLDDLANFLITHEVIKRKLPQVCEINTELEDVLTSGDEHQPISDAVVGEIKVPQLWSELLDAEEEAFRTVVIAGEKRQSPFRNGQILVPYHVDTGVIDYDRSDTVIVENQITDGVWKSCGQLNLRDTTFGESAELAIDNPYIRAGFAIGQKLRLISTLERGSFTRRRFAIERILEKKSVISELIEYFEDTECKILDPISYQIPSDEDLEVYSNGEKKLNPSQQEAFKRVISNGPVSLLQGPPGTGKTYFIAALLHYLLTKESARRILLVSQAHEAVNNALEKTLDLFSTQKRCLDAVRLGSESATSAAIRHLHATSIEQCYRERFKAEQKERVVKVTSSLGLPKAFAQDFIELHLRLGSLAEQIAKLERRATTSSESQGTLQARIRSLTDTFIDIASDLYNILGLTTPAEIIQSIEDKLIAKYDIRSAHAIDSIRKLISLSNEWLGTLGSPDGYFTEFLAKSRSVVAGTCVGIGYRGAGVVNNIYDWVIIDEAGRAAPSELAVAMQAGRRVLLVGDHKQLPPTFPDEVKTIIEGRLGVDSISRVFSSDFERIFDSQYGKKVGATLLTQYRMAPVIGEIVSSCFYDDELETGRDNPPEYYDLLPPYLSTQVTWIDTSQLKEKAYHKQSSNQVDKWNDVEAKLVMRVVRDILESDCFLPYLEGDLSPQEPAIGIICMYSKQREVIDRLKSEEPWIGEARRLIKVDTVDSYQGKENRIVILSTVRNNKQKSPGFLSSPNRINVAMSRAMERLIIIGSTDMWRGGNSDLPLGRVLSKVENLQTELKSSIVSATQFVRP